MALYLHHFLPRQHFLLGLEIQYFLSVLAIQYYQSALVDHYPLLLPLDLLDLEDQLILNHSDLEHLLLLCHQLDLVIPLVLYLHHSLQHLYYRWAPVIQLSLYYRSDLENRPLYYQSVPVILYLHRYLQHLYSLLDLAILLILYYQSVLVIQMILYYQ